MSCRCSPSRPHLAPIGSALLYEREQPSSVFGLAACPCSSVVAKSRHQQLRHRSRQSSPRHAREGAWGAVMRHPGSVGKALLGGERSPV